MVIKRVKGDTYPLDIQLIRVDETVVDLTGATVFFTVKRTLQDNDSEALIKKDITSFTDAANGLLSVSFTSTDVNYIGEFYYDVKIKYTSGLIESVINDKFILIDHVTLRTS